MLDTIIRGGSIIDGTGAPGVVGDIGIVGGKIVDIGGRITGTARNEIDADGALVTPGFVDIHTHYDGQVLWDDELDSSFSNGVTTAIAGNCGVGFAPARHEFRRELVEMMEGVEDIPGIVLDAGLDWKWTSFADYLDRIAERSYTMDVAAAITHAPLRVFVMGERALNHEAATAEDIEAMAALVRDAMKAGACGFSSGRVQEHRSSVGEFIPGTFSESEELLGIARAMGAHGTGVFQLIPKGASGDVLGFGISAQQRRDEHDLLVEIARVSGRPLTYLIMEWTEEPSEWRTIVAASERAAAEGLVLRPQASPRQIGLLLSIDGYHIFQCRPSYMAIAHLPRAERIKAMRDPELRRKILTEANCSDEEAATRMVGFFANRFVNMLETFYSLCDPSLDYEPTEDRRLDRMAAASGQTMQEVLYDLLTAGEGNGIAVQFAFNYSSGNLDAPYEMMSHKQVLTGLGDGGAHLLLSCDAAMPTFQLSFWARDRQRGPRFPIEAVVHRMTGDPAALYDMHDRGTLALGKRADINVIDFDKLSLDIPRMEFDLPNGAGRLIQRSRGYLATMVNGEVTRRFDQDTGARPGRLRRS